MEIDKVLIMPYVTEKTEMLNQNSKKGQVVVFKVHKNATKTMIKEAIYRLYNVKAMKVNIINQPYKKTRFRNIITKKPGFKKAIITLEPGKTIKFD
ncbi:MAG: 50S ribosomal protein L23 [Leptospiraceae bacterium]|nr:MAG: 50S ribosomal protein L23 [Leptospiraceae bacterium]